MLSIIRDVTTKEIVFASYGTVSQTTSGVTCDQIEDLSGDDWGTDAGFEKIEADIELPGDYFGGSHKLIEDGDGYRFDVIS